MTAPGIVKKRVREHSHESNDDATTQPLVELPFSSRGHPGVAPLAEKSEVDLPDPVVDEEVTFVLAGAHIGQLAVLVESVVESCVMAEMITDAKNIIDCAAPVREQTGVPPSGISGTGAQTTSCRFATPRTNRVPRRFQTTAAIRGHNRYGGRAHPRLAARSLA